jgi:hypothetical protein
MPLSLAEEKLFAVLRCKHDVVCGVRGRDAHF